MSVAFYMDEHVHRAITVGLRLRGVDVLTVQEDGKRKMLDEDLLALATRCQRDGISFVGVGYAHQLRVSIGDCVRDLELIGKGTNPEDLANRVEYLPL